MKGGNNLLVTTYWSIDSALIHSYTLPYVEQIKSCLPENSRIFLLTLSPKSAIKLPATGALIKELGRKGIYVLNFRYYPFGFRMLLNFAWMFPYLIIFCYLKRIKGLHAWCTPGGAIAWLISLCTGLPLVIDSFEPHAESMLESGAWTEKSFAYRLLLRLEKNQLKIARDVICAAPGMPDHSKVVYGIAKKRYFVKPAGVDLNLFDPEKYSAALPDLKLKGKVCVYAGKFGDLYLDREVFDFFCACNEYWNGDFSVLLLSGQSQVEVERLCLESGFAKEQVHHFFVPHQDVPAFMARAHFGICTIKPVPSKQFGSPIKNGEYWAMGLPIVIPQHISIDSQIVSEENAGYVLKTFDRQEYLNAAGYLDNLFRKENNYKSRIRKIAEAHRSYSRGVPIYQAIYSRT